MMSLTRRDGSDGSDIDADSNDDFELLSGKD